MKTLHAGFTLIELLVVVLIIGILSSVALPQYQKAVLKARSAEAVQTIATLERALEVFILEDSGNTRLSDIADAVSVSFPRCEGSDSSAWCTANFRYAVLGVCNSSICWMIVSDRKNYGLPNLQSIRSSTGVWNRQCTYTEMDSKEAELCRTVFKPLGFTEKYDMPLRPMS